MKRMLSHPAPARMLHLDVLRGVAILMVLGRHRPFAVPERTFGAWVYAAWMRVGWAGVDLFFVLSGFLIGGLLLAEHRKQGGIRFGRFFVRRAFKIWPTYLVFLAAGFARDVFDIAPADIGLSVAARARNSMHAIWPFFVQIQNYKETEIHSVIGTAWSLAIEEHFYLLLPLLLYALGRKKAGRVNPYRSLPWIGAGLAVVCLGLRFNARRIHPQWDEFAHHLPTHLRIDSLFAGVTLAYGVHFARPTLDALRRYRWSILLASMACFVPFARDSYSFSYTSWKTTTFGYTALMLGSMGLVLSAWFGSQPSARTANPSTSLPGQTPRLMRALVDKLAALLAMIGVRSYSIYLFHVLAAVPVVMWLEPKLGPAASRWHVPMMMGLYLSLAIGFGSLAYYLIESPSVVVRDWLFPGVLRGKLPEENAKADDLPRPTIGNAAA